MKLSFDVEFGGMDYFYLVKGVIFVHHGTSPQYKDKCIWSCAYCGYKWGGRRKKLQKKGKRRLAIAMML